MKIVADERIPFVREYFGSLGELTVKPGREISAHDVKAADILLVRTVTNVDATLLADSSVRFVGSVTAGADHLDKAWLAKNNIACATADGFNAPAVADYVVSTVAALQRRSILTKEKRKAAVVGVGRVGTLVVDRLRLLGFDVLMCDPLRADAQHDFDHTLLDKIADVDLISLHTPLTDDGLYPTRHMIAASFLKRQRPGCVLLNAGRGEVISAAALAQSGSHLVWCFDVWPHEPAIDKTMLENTLFATPHIAGYSVQSKMRGTEMIYRAACEALALNAAPLSSLELPHQEIRFAGESHHWQDVVLGIYNPMMTTAMMRATLLPADNPAYYFDEMRHQFRYRYELAYSKVAGAVLSDADAALLSQLGVSQV